jgi:hypothetical protein
MSLDDGIPNAPICPLDQGPCEGQGTDTECRACIQKGPPACPVDEQQCDAECQARPDRACATDPKSAEWDRARTAIGWLQQVPPYSIPVWTLDTISRALTVGEAAEKRAVEAERERDEAQRQVLAITKRCVRNESALELPENALRQRVNMLEEKLDEACALLQRTEARARKLEETLMAVSTDIAQDALEDPIGHDERKRAGWYRLFAGTMGAVRSALDPPKEG